MIDKTFFIEHGLTEQEQNEITYLYPNLSGECEPDHVCEARERDATIFAKGKLRLPLIRHFGRRIIDDYPHIQFAHEYSEALHWHFPLPVRCVKVTIISFEDAGPHARQVRTIMRYAAICPKCYQLVHGPKISAAWVSKYSVLQQGESAQPIKTDRSKKSDEQHEVTCESVLAWSQHPGHGTGQRRGIRRHLARCGACRQEYGHLLK